MVSGFSIIYQNTDLPSSELLQCNNNNLYLYSCLIHVIYYKTILKIKLEYWLPGISIRPSGVRQPVDINIKRSPLGNGQLTAGSTGLKDASEILIWLRSSTTQDKMVIIRVSHLSTPHLLKEITAFDY